MTEIWQQTDEYMNLKNAYTQGYVAELAEFSIVDNPYPYFSASWINWMCGFQYAVRKHYGGEITV